MQAQSATQRKGMCELWEVLKKYGPGFESNWQKSSFEEQEAREQNPNNLRRRKLLGPILAGHRQEFRL